MSDHAVARPKAKRHLFLVPPSPADEIDAHPRPSGDDIADRSWTWLLDGLDTPAATARLYVTEILNRWNLAMVASRATLVVYGLVSKAAQHAESPIMLTVRVDKTTEPPTLEISVNGGDPATSDHGGIGPLLACGPASFNTTANNDGRSLTARIPCTDCA